MLGGVRDEFVQDHRYCLARLGPQEHVGPFDVRVVVSRIGCELALEQLVQRQALPLPIAQQLMRRGQRPNSRVESRYKMRHRAAGFECTRGDGGNGREHILHPMVELGQQQPLMIFGMTALSHVDIETDHALWSLVSAIHYQAARLDPAYLSSWTNDAILDAVLFPTFAKGLRPEILDPVAVIRMSSISPVVAPRFGRSLGQTVKGSLAFRDLHRVATDVIGISANAGGLLSK